MVVFGCFGFERGQRTESTPAYVSTALGYSWSPVDSEACILLRSWNLKLGPDLGPYWGISKTMNEVIRPVTKGGFPLALEFVLVSLYIYKILEIEIPWWEELQLKCLSPF